MGRRGEKISALQNLGWVLAEPGFPSNISNGFLEDAATWGRAGVPAPSSGLCGNLENHQKFPFLMWCLDVKVMALALWEFPGSADIHSAC